MDRATIEHIPLNCPIDSLLGGGLPRRMITQVYGPPGSGKSNLALQATINATKMGRKVLFIDTEGSFSEQRITQMQPGKEALQETMLIEAASLKEQGQAIQKANSIKNLGLIVVDSPVYYYRLEMDKEDPHRANRELGLQMAMLVDIARRLDIPVLVTNQVYSNPDTKTLDPVGGDVMRYASKVIIELSNNAERQARVVRHSFAKEGQKAVFKIVGKGVI